MLAALVLAIVGGFAYGCSLESEGQLAPDGGTATGGSGGAGGNTDAGPDQETPDVGTSDVPCFPPNKVCANQCVAYDDPDYGCHPDTCDPCDSPPHAIMGCVNNKCEIIGCEVGWGDCDADFGNGCETSTRTAANCGECGEPCAPPNAVGLCATGQCEVGFCNNDWADCNDNPADGCEIYLRDVDNCGACGEVCQVSGGEPTCVTGKCKVDTCDTPVTGMADCDSDPTDCETDVTQTDNCGACGNTCGFTNDHVAQWACNNNGSAWACDIGSCVPPWDNCDGDPATGCANNLDSSVNRCGSCNGVCSGDNTENRACVNGVCVPTCVNGYEDCDGPEPGAGDNGCETSVSDDVNNCGACGNQCDLDHAVENCQFGMCGIQSCEGTYGNCNGQTNDGCETDTSSNVLHCGSCGFACSTSGGNPSCNNGSCNIDCDPGSGNCDGNDGNGCETDLTTTSNCGACGNECDKTNGTASCDPPDCKISCFTDYDDCNGNVDDGCEISLQDDPNHCGGCGDSCSTNHVPTPVCSGGNCTGGCEPGFADCLNDKRVDGCETELDTDPDHCGACGDACSDNHMDTVVCSDGNCTGNCAVGFSDCVNGKRADGCETNTSSDTSNCGGCGSGCSSDNVEGLTCDDGVCSGSCATDWGNCDGNLRANGCEQPLSDDVDNCGTCGGSCSSEHVDSRECIDGKCEPTCTAPYADCNGPEPGETDDGCETNTDTDPTACGSCTIDCTSQALPVHASWECDTGTCKPDCDPGWQTCGDLTQGCYCPETFVCPGGTCKCNHDDDCGTDGVCDEGSGLCECDYSGGSGTLTTCGVGEVCGATACE